MLLDWPIRGDGEKTGETMKKEGLDELDFEYNLFFFFFFFKLYNIVLVLPNIKMNPPQVYLCSPS